MFSRHAHPRVVCGDVRRFATRCWELLGDPNLVPCVAYGVKRRTRWGKPRKHFGELLRHNREKLRGRAERYDQKWTRFVIGFFRGSVVCQNVCRYTLNHVTRWAIDKSVT